ncbi:MAG: transcription termination/antitermination factor NusG [Oscillospiraceae bacterium]|jgi:transcriptional antiterminator NusG|nr:transcription termination/antitermination factor NusG [Oscillospiraceae bacterium]
MAEEAKWYVVHTYSGYENKVMTTLKQSVESRHLENLIKDVLVPTETAIEVGKDNKQKEVERKLFPGYVFVKMIMTDDAWYIVRNTRGVTGFVGSATKPVPLTEAEVANLGVEKKQVEVNYAVGDTVQIVGGALEGFTGTVEEIDIEANSVKVTVSMFGRSTPAEVELHQVILA